MAKGELVKDVAAAALRDQPFALGFDVVGPEEEPIEHISGAYTLPRLAEAHHADTDPRGPLGGGKAFT